MMSSEEAEPAAEPWLYRLFSLFDPEAMAVVTILLGLVQVLLSMPLYYTNMLPNLFLLPLIIGALIVAGGSFTVASERFPSRQLLRGCACSNLLGLLGALLAFCLYLFTLTRVHANEPCESTTDNLHDYDYPTHKYWCPSQQLMVFGWCVTLLLILYDTAALLMHSFLSLNAEPPAILANQMEKLQDLSQSELQELLASPEKVESMALESDEIQNIQLEREMALASNRSLAEQNLDMKPHLESQKEMLVQRYSQLEAVRETYRQHCILRDGMVGQVSPEALLSRLQTEGAKTEAESEALAEEFLEGSLPLDSFLEHFLSLRSLALKRRVRIEKLQEILRQRSEGSNPSAISQDPPTTTPSPWNQQTTTATTTNQQQPQNQSASSSSASSGLPFTPYPVSPPNAPPVAAAAASGPANPPSQFPPYPPSGSPFTPAASYSSPRPAFGPPAAATCPYPTQASFPAPHPGSAFGQYTPSSAQSGLPRYPASYSYGGYSYPAGPAYPSSQSPTGRPIYRPGYGVPQPYS
ncbi:hypothetical protein LDENG_00104550 [Lucifuga dentata]|nr:hypothetical protein LDENG_00104550 [Lucifuga dentata]